MAPQCSATLLYIEDNPVNVLLMVALLDLPALAHLRLLIAVDGATGLEMVRRERPDLILLDLQLPDMDGLIVLQALRSRARTAAVPVIALSADALPAQIQAALAAGCLDYWTKPLDPSGEVAALASRYPAPPQA